MTLGSSGSSRTDVKEDVRSTARIDLTLGVLGATGGAILGHYLFGWIASQGLYAIALPGALTGLGCGALSGRRSIPLGILSGILGLIVGVYTEWRAFPFIADDSLSYFLAHLHDITGLGKIAIILGAILACWFGIGRERGTWPRRRSIARNRKDVV